VTQLTKSSQDVKKMFTKKYDQNSITCSARDSNTTRDIFDPSMRNGN